MKNAPLLLHDNDPAVIAARNAEQHLFAHYGLQGKDLYITLPVQGIRVRITEMGYAGGKPLLVVPGNTGDVFPLASLLAQLKHRRIIALNRPGGGLSEGLDHTTVDLRPFAVQTIVAALDEFGLDSADVLAHSMGAHWSLWAAMDAPQRISSLTMLGNPGNVMAGKPPLAIRLLMWPPFNKLLFKLMAPADKSKALNPLRTMGHSKQTLARQPKALGECYYYFRRLPHYFASAASLFKNPAANIDAAQLALVKQPAQLLLGDKDNFASVGIGKSIVTAMPHGTLHVIAGAGHLPWLENPALCGDIVKTFLERQG